MQYLLGTNCRMPLLHMSKSCIWIEETNQRINEFYIVYMKNPNFNTNRAFREQVNVCFKNKFGQIPIYISVKRYPKKIQEC